MNLKKLFFLPSLLMLLGTIPVLAQDPTYNGSSIYIDGSNNIFLATSSVSIGDRAKIEITNIDLVIQRNSDGCGIFSIKFPKETIPPPSTVSIDGISTDVSTATGSTKKDWTCVGGSLTSGTGITPGTTNPIVLINHTYYFFRTPYTTYLVAYVGTVVKQIKVNKCQYAELRYNPRQKITDFSTIRLIVNGVNIPPMTIASLRATPGIAPATPSCHKGVIVLPSNWTF